MFQTIIKPALTLCVLMALGCDAAKPMAPASPQTPRAPYSPKAPQAPQEPLSPKTPISPKAPAQPQAPALVPAPTSTRVKAASARVPRTPERIVSLAPNITEILFALGVGERVVGVTKYCDYPEQVKKLPKVGGFMQPDSETLVGLGADLILGMASGPTQKLPATLDALDQTYVFVQMDTIAQTHEGILTLGRLVEKEAEAKAMVADMRRQMVKIERGKEAPSTLFVLGHKPMVVASTGSFGAELIELAGGKLAFTSSNPYPIVDMEHMLKLNPEIIVDTTMTSGTPLKAFWSKHKSLRAVANDRVHTLHDPSLLRPGPRLVQAYKRMKSLLSPEVVPAEEAMP